VCVYAMRGKRDEPYISMPLSWSELTKARAAENPATLMFSPEQALRKMKKVGDLFAPVLTTRQYLPDAFQQLDPTAARSAGRKSPPSPAPKEAEGGSRSAALSRYMAKRDFAHTAEPKGQPGKTSGRVGEQRFVIQKHDASRLHYDFRLEMNGTLKSWAVPKGPPYELGVKRAAFEVEDHPLDYMQFEGTIPKGQYGGGTVMVWDIGTYELLGGSIEKGDLKLRLDGRKLKGEWHIFRIKSESSKPMWLLAKSGTAAKPISARRDDSSVLTGRSMARIARDNDAQWERDRADPVRASPALVRTQTRAGAARKPPRRRSVKRAAKKR